MNNYGGYVTFEIDGATHIEEWVETLKEGDVLCDFCHVLMRVWEKEDVVGEKDLGMICPQCLYIVD